MRRALSVMCGTFFILHACSRGGLRGSYLSKYFFEMEKEKNLLAVIMTVHNRRETTLECLRRFYQCRIIERYDVDFYMMDDGCTDGTAEAVAAHFPQVTILKGDGSLFWNRGMYYCWKEAIKKYHDFYLWLNDDTMLFDKSLDVIFTDLNCAGGHAIISGCCCDSETQSITTYGGSIGQHIVSVNGHIQLVEYMNGNFVLIPNTVVDKIGIIDPYFRHSAGDTEYGLRAKKNGIPVFVSSDYVGICNRHAWVCKSMDARYSFRERLLFINTPWGARPKESFYLYNKYENFWKGVYMWFIAYFYCFFPKK